MEECQLLEDHKHMAPGPPGAWGLIMLTPGTPVSYLTIYQSENCALSDHTPWNSPVIWPLKMLCWNPTGEFRVVSSSCPGFLASFPAVNAALSFTTTQVSLERLYCTWASRLKFGSVIIILLIYPALTLSPKQTLAPVVHTDMPVDCLLRKYLLMLLSFFVYIQIAITYLPLNTMLLCDAYVE